MTRLLTAIKTDATVQVRNNLYTIGISFATLVAVLLAWLAPPNQLPAIIPALMLLVIGGTTLLYVAAMIFFEKDEGTLSANIVSPMRTSEYLWSKIITLTGLATLESVIMIGGALLIMRFWEKVTLPNIALLLIGIVTIGIIYTLIGILLVVRYDRFLDFLIPMAAVAAVLQLPFLYLGNLIKHWIFLLVPTSAPSMLIQGAYIQLAAWKWVYGVGYTAVLIIGLTVWAYRAFHRHIILKVG